MYFPTDTDDTPRTPFRAPKYTTSFPRLTSIARNLLSDEGFDLPFYLRLGHAVAPSPTSPLQKTEFFLRRRGKDSCRFAFTLTSPCNSRFVFAMNGVGQLEGEIFRTYADRSADADAASDADGAKPAPLAPGEEEETPPHAEDGRGVRWRYDPVFGGGRAAVPSYVDFFWDRSYHVSKSNYLRWGFVVGGMPPPELVPFTVNISGIDLGATLLAVRGPWALGLDSQVRCMWLDLTGGRVHLNSVVAYQKPCVALNLNMHDFGDRFITSVVANPVGLYKLFRKSTNKNEDLYNCPWLVGAEAETVHRNNGTYHTQRLSFGFAIRSTHVGASSHQNEANSEKEVFKVDEPLMRSAESRIKFDILDQDVDSVRRLSLYNSARLRLPGKVDLQLGASIQVNVLPLDPRSVRTGFSATFIV